MLDGALDKTFGRNVGCPDYLYVSFETHPVHFLFCNDLYETYAHKAAPFLPDLFLTCLQMCNAEPHYGS